MRQPDIYIYDHPRNVLNYDPALGGSKYRAPFLAPFTAFGSAVKSTPSSTPDYMIIPWDHVSKDYVYGAVDSNTFGGRMTPLQLKQVKNRKNCKKLIFLTAANFLVS